MELINQTADWSTRFYRLNGQDYRVMFSQHTGGVFAVHKRAADGEFRKCPRSAEHYVRRALAKAAG